MEVQVLKQQLDTLGSSRDNNTRQSYPDSGVKVKVAVVGPRQGGKTRISAQLANRFIPPDDHYEPTAGVRILEFEESVTSKNKKGQSANVKVEVELWDLSGDTSENLWPAVIKDLHGVMVVFDPTSKQQANDVRIWCEWFCKSAKLETGQCVIFAHGALTSRHKPLSVKGGTNGETRTVSVPIVNVNFMLKNEQTGEAFPSQAKIEFNKMIGDLYASHPDAVFN